MLDETKKFFFQRLIQDTIGYYRIYDFLKLSVERATNTVRSFTSTENFWKAILQNEFKHIGTNEPPIYHNQLIRLTDFFLTEWTPKLPGRMWTKDGERNLIDGIQDIAGQFNIHEKVYEVLGPMGKNKMVTGGYGSVRVKPRSDSDYCMLLNAVSINEWHCDSGIPIIVSKSVYAEYLRYANGEGAPEIAELTGILLLNNGINQMNIITPAIGARLEPELQDLLSDIPNLPKCFIYVSSPLNIRLRYNGSHPQAIAWTMFKTNVDQEPLRLTYSRFDPTDEESSKEAVNFINEYVLGFNGTEILTDFDGQRRRLISKSTLADTRNFRWQHRRALNTIGAWVRRENRNNLV